MSPPSAHVTAAEISRIAGVTRATVSNWRRRHGDFPAPVAGTDSSPLYDLAAVQAWLRARGRTSAATPVEELRTTLRMHAALRMQADGGAIAKRLVVFVLAAARFTRAESARLSELNDADLAKSAEQAVAALPDAVPGADRGGYEATHAPVLRALLQCIRTDGPQAALDVLAERELEDSASTGAYPTPRPVAELMAKLLQPRTGPYPSRVFDPACGSGTLLAAAAEHGASTLAGQDRLLIQAQRSAVRLLLASPDAKVTVRAGDSLRADAFPDLAADGVLCSPPYGDRDWGHDRLAYDPRWEYGVPPRAEPELAWVQHVLAHLAPGRLAVVLLPPSVASRSSGRRVRGELLRRGALRAVIALPPGAATPLHIGLHLWVLRHPAPADGGDDTVLFVDTSGEPFPGPPSESARAQSRHGAADWERVATTALDQWHAFSDDQEGFTGRQGTARAVPVVELLDEFVDVTPTRRVHAAATSVNPAATAHRAGELIRQLVTSVDALKTAATVGGRHMVGDEPRSWRTATVADLARGGALTLHRAVRGSHDVALPAEHAGRPVLTGRDLASGTPASGDSREGTAAPVVIIYAGDVILPALLGPRGAVSRVTGEQDAGCLLGPNLHLLRPDTERLDPWFLAGFLAAPGNLSAAAIGSSILHLNARRLRVPLLPLNEQRRYGEAFRRLHELRTAARRAEQAATEAANTLSAGLTSGALLPPDDAPGDSP